MRTPYRHKFTLLFVLCCIVYSAESRYKDGRRKSDKLSASSSSTALSYGGGGGGTALASSTEHRSLCSRHREMKLLCYCTPDESYVPVTKAECWIFQSGLLQNDTTWQLFFQQKKLRQLKFVVQNSGHLDYIPTKYIEPLSNLTTVTIEYSQIQVVKSYAFASLPNLRLITLTNNQIEVLDKDAFANHIYLTELHLQHNQITEMDRFAFRNLPMLMKLYLNRNNISTLHEEVFSELGKLEELNLEHNSISVLTSDMFKGLGNLKLLKLTYNNLNFIGDTVFAELWSLQELELDDNHIERISERALDGLNNLQTLNLRNNVLKKLDNGLLRGTPALLSINLQDNLLETVTFYTFQPIMDNLVNSTSELLLSDNKFICDCRLQWIFDLRNRTRNLQLKESLEEIICTLHMDPKSATKAGNNFVKPIIDNEVGLLPAGAASGLPKRTRARGSTRRQLEKKRQSQKFSMGLGSTGIDASDAKVDISGDDGIDNNNSNNNYADKTNTRTRAMRDNKNGGHGTGTGTGTGTAAAEYYEDDATLFGQSHEFEDGLDFMKEPALYMHQGVGTVAVSKDVPLDDGAEGGTGDVVVKLLTLCPTDLPCSGELSDPTELPLSRESIGMDVRSPLLTSGGSSSAVNMSGWLCGSYILALIVLTSRNACVRLRF